jgi:exodeoxyribonuclease VII small subunit
MAFRTEEIKQLDFEEAYKRLSETTGQLERGNLSLEESLALYEEGVALARHCETLLDNAELRVSQITPGFSNPFEDDEDEE